MFNLVTGLLMEMMENLLSQHSVYIKLDLLANTIAHSLTV